MLAGASTEMNFCKGLSWELYGGVNQVRVEISLNQSEGKYKNFKSTKMLASEIK